MQVFLQHDCSSNFINGSLVPALLLFHAHVDHGSLRHTGSISFIYHYNGDCREGLFYFFHDLSYGFRGVGIGVVKVLGFTDDDLFNLLLYEIIFKKINKFWRFNSGLSPWQ